ncbi:MAG TPA: aldehyde dehydrogenase family protein, partial [Pseudomonadales bacterium]|nr:aldehyde dehydrogenase family protein [Pseudomonadales bacterium]
MNTKTNIIKKAAVAADEPALKRTIECFSPATGEFLGSVPALSPAEVQEAVAKARQAQKVWAKSTFKQRRAVLQHILNHVLTHADELCEYIVKDSG